MIEFCDEEKIKKFVQSKTVYSRDIDRYAMSFAFMYGYSTPSLLPELTRLKDFLSDAKNNRLTQKKYLGGVFLLLVKKIDKHNRRLDAWK